MVGGRSGAVAGGVAGVFLAASEATIVGHQVSSDFRGKLGNSGSGGGKGG